MGHVHFEKGRRLNFFSFFFFPSLLIITEIAGMHDPENKAASWESPPEASPSSVLLSIVRLPSWMPPTPGMSEVEAVPPTPEEPSPGNSHSAPTSQTPEAERKKSRWRGTGNAALSERRGVLSLSLSAN